MQHIALLQVPEAQPPGAVALRHRSDQLEVMTRWLTADREAMRKVCHSVNASCIFKPEYDSGNLNVILKV